MLNLKRVRWWLLGFGLMACLAGGVFLFFRFSRPPRDRPAVGEITSAPFSPPTNSKLAVTDWPRFRGPAGSGFASDAHVPTEWSDTKNLRWKINLPGPGSSSPIVVGSRVLVTCYTGYGDAGSEKGRPEDLKRQLLCLDRSTGKTLWSATVPSEHAENAYRGYLTEHGYASATPVSDGESVFVFFGKSGVFAFDLEGNKKWQAPVGTQSDNRRWGSSASPIIVGDRVIVNASSEARAILAFDKTTGREVWRSPAKSLDLTFGTPSAVTLEDGRVEVVLAIPGEVWGIDPSTGKLNWFAEVRIGGNVSPSVVIDQGKFYATGGYEGEGTVAIRPGGSGNVTKTHVLWSVRNRSYVPSPVVHQGHLFWVDEAGKAVCLNAETGTVVFEQKLEIQSDRRKPVYASPVLVGDRIIAVSRGAGAYVFEAKPSFKLLATNVLADESDFNASPAVSGPDLFLRSNVSLYCIASQP